jgi:hypothetical protein
MLWFGVLGYAAAIAGIFPLDLTSATSWIPNVVVGAVVAALVWAAGRGQAWAGALFSVAIVFSVIAAIGQVWDGAPAWLRFETEGAVTTWMKITDVVTVVFGVAAMAVYLHNRRHAAAQA